MKENRNDTLIKCIEEYYKDTTIEKGLYQLHKMIVAIANGEFVMPIEVKDNQSGIKILEHSVDNQEIRIIPIFTDFKKTDQYLGKKQQRTVLTFSQIRKILFKYKHIVDGFILNPNSEHSLFLSIDRINAIFYEVVELLQSLEIKNDGLIEVIDDFIKRHKNTNKYIDKLSTAKFLIPIKVKEPTIFAFIEDQNGYMTLQDDDGYYIPIFTEKKMYDEEYALKVNVNPLVMTIQDISILTLGTDKKCKGAIINPHKDNIFLPKEYLGRIFR